MEANPVQHNQNAGEEESSNDEAMDENLSNQVEISVSFNLEISPLFGKLNFY